MNDKEEIFLYTIKKGTMYFLTVIAILAGIFLKTPTSISASEEIEINEQVFPEKDLREKAASFDKNEDGMLSKSEIAQAKTISIYKFLDIDDIDEDDTSIVVPHYEKSDFVFDFKGIQYFTSLEKLEMILSFGRTDEGKHYPSVLFHFDEIYALKNLRSFKLYSGKQKNIDLSKLPKLKTVILSIPNISNITIDNKYLKKFELSDSTSKLKSINFQNAPKLKKLYLSKMKDTELVFGPKNTSIQNLSIQCDEKIKINSLSLAYLKNLKSFSCEKLNISEIDFSKNINLESVYIKYSFMKTLDFSKNKKLDWIHCEGKKTKKIIIPKENVISTFRWEDGNLDTFENEDLNPDTLKAVILRRNHIKSVDLTRYKNLEFVAVDEGVTVKLAPELNPEEIIYE